MRLLLKADSMPHQLLHKFMTIFNLRLMRYPQNPLNPGDCCFEVNMCLLTLVKVEIPTPDFCLQHDAVQLARTRVQSVSTGDLESALAKVVEDYEERLAQLAQQHETDLNMKEFVRDDQHRAEISVSWHFAFLVAQCLKTEQSRKKNACYIMILHFRVSVRAQIVCLFLPSELLLVM